MIESEQAYVPGDPWMICDECSFRYRRSEMRRRWDGAMVCPDDWEPQHPQEFVRGVAEKIVVNNARPEQSATEPTYITTSITQDDL